jgi:hypothetical protein
MSLISKVYINDIFQGQTDGTTWPISKIYTQSAPFGQSYYLPMSYYTQFIWRIDSYNTITGQLTTGDNWTFTTKQVPSYIPPRPDGYLPDSVWAWTGTEYDWVTTPNIIVAGGGRYNQILVVIGNKTIYYGVI